MTTLQENSIQELETNIALRGTADINLVSKLIDAVENMISEKGIVVRVAQHAKEGYHKTGSRILINSGMTIDTISKVGIDKAMKTMAEMTLAYIKAVQGDNAYIYSLSVEDGFRNPQQPLVPTLMIAIRFMEDMHGATLQQNEAIDFDKVDEINIEFSKLVQALAPTRGVQLAIQDLDEKYNYSLTENISIVSGTTLDNYLLSLDKSESITRIAEHVCAYILANKGKSATVFSITLVTKKINPFDPSLKALLVDIRFIK